MTDLKFFALAVALTLLGIFALATKASSDMAKIPVTPSVKPTCVFLRGCK